MDANLRDLITRARALIADPKRWCHHRMARRADGGATIAEDPLATQWCASGALTAAGADESMFYRAKAILDLQAEKEYARQFFRPTWWHDPDETTPIKRLCHVNDYLGHEAVLRVYDLVLGQ